MAAQMMAAFGMRGRGRGGFPPFARGRGGRGGFRGRGERGGHGPSTEGGGGAPSNQAPGGDAQ